MRNRQKQRENRKKYQEEHLDRRNDAGYLDLTAYMAVAMIKRDEAISVKTKTRGMK